MSGSLRSLEPSVSSRVRSAQSLESLTQCGLELVQNGVDAGASSLVVKVDTAAWTVKVSDNGRGISREELQSLVGERYVTSKHQQPGLRDCPRFGFRGEALASIVQIAQTVEISSRHRLSQLTCCKLFKGGRNSGLVPPPVNLNHAGTVVTAHDLFYNLPVRRRHMSPSLEIERLRSALCRVLLVLPQVSLSLHDDQAGLRLLHVPRASSLLMRFHQLFGNKTVEQKDLEHDRVKASALFAVQSFGRNNLQLIFLNGRSVEWQSMHELVRMLLKPVSAMKTATGTLHLFYVITIECNMELVSQFTPERTHLHLEQERRVAKALTSLIGSFLYSNHLPISHCLPPPPPPPPPPSKLLHSSQLLPATTTVYLSSPPSRPSSQISIPAHWELAVDPATSRRLQIHPISGSSLQPTPSPLPGDDNKKSDNSYCCAFQSLPNSFRSRVRTVPALTSSAKAHIGTRSLASTWVNPTFSAGEQAVLNVGKTHNSSQYKFSKESLKNTSVLGQVDNKFIACLFGIYNSPHVLVVVDQHAAHERVRLEAVLEDLYSDGEKVKMARLDPPLPLPLSPAQKRVARSFSGKLEAIGVTLVWREGLALAHSAPAVLVQRKTCSLALLQEMVQSYLEVLMSTGGGSAGLPSSLTAVLHSQACHGAIRFGDYLDLRQCRQLIDSLAKCSLPFQCAHGRPSLAPIINLNTLAKRCPSLATPFPHLTVLTLKLNANSIIEK